MAGTGGVTRNYKRTATYNGDSNNNSFKHKTEYELPKCLEFRRVLYRSAGGTVVIGSGTPLTDTAVLSGGYNPTGTITFNLYSPGNVVIDTETVTVKIGRASSRARG